MPPLPKRQALVFDCARIYTEGGLFVMTRSQNILILLVVLLAGCVVVFGIGWSAELLCISSRTETTLPKTFNLAVTEALAEVPTISPVEADQAMRSNPNALVIDVRDAADIAGTGLIPGAVNISLGTLTYKADNQVPPEWRDSQLENRARQIITTCESGEMAALGGKLLKDMGFTNVRILEGGTVAWKAAGYPTQ